MYTAVVLEKDSREKLIRRFAHIIPNDWDIVAHHMTINMGSVEKGPLRTEDALEQVVTLEVADVAMNDKVIAVRVESDIPSKNKNKHITIAVNRKEGGKPKMSNNLQGWEPLSDPLLLFGTVEEVQ